LPELIHHSGFVEGPVEKTSTAGPTKHSVVESSIDPLQQISKSMQELSKRVSPGGVQIFSSSVSMGVVSSVAR
jgi:hypothetical protein